MANMSDNLNGGSCSRYSSVGSATIGDGHSWVEFQEDDDNVIIADAYNAVYYRCPGKRGEKK
jgi:hypothetical protein